MNYKLVLLLLAHVAFTVQLQLPFHLDGILPQTSSKAHYSSVDPRDHPINLSQYAHDSVIRIDYSQSRELETYLKSKSSNETSDSIVFKKWGKNISRKTIDIQISQPDMFKLIQKFKHALKFEVLIDDLPQKIFETYPQASAQSEEVVTNTELFFQDYRNLDTINAWLELLAASYPEIISLEDIGETFEHRKLKVVHFTVPHEHPDDEDHGDRRTVVITGGVHSREWISVSSTLYAIYELVELYKVDPDSKIFVELDFLFIPVYNPDGYQYTWNTDRLWRKNRQKTIKPNCFGIDIDHAFDYHWTRSSDWACGDEYSGEYPFEALEARIWHEYLNETNADHKIWGFIDLHSYAEEILYPYAFSCEDQPRDEENLIEVAYGLAKAIRLQTGRLYQVFAACLDRDADLLPDLGAGTILDYMYHNRADFAYQLKLRDTGNHGFLLPAKQIIPVGKEVVASLKYLFHFLIDNDR
ncbi:putative metallocarboxypeptidase ECM14 [Candida viswanathii]|jgi:extracellular matrix protein 14|uniref:Inactive metallocarboxypeptidase ECM14 n=1 Tax=Candida viswanathii TaxID=5486 RepID=A0A367XYY2_9ASCO|nr:putative metallocarboxypeptidase ECM14 [Candida viswanathii]